MPGESSMTRRRNGRFDDVPDERFVAEIFDVHLAASGQRVFQRHDSVNSSLRISVACNCVSRAHTRWRQHRAVIQHFVGNIAREHAVHPHLHARVHLAELRSGGATRGWSFRSRQDSSPRLSPSSSLRPFFTHRAGSAGVRRNLQQHAGVREAHGPRAAHEQRLAEESPVADTQADAGCVRYSRSAAREKLPSLATIRNTCNSPSPRASLRDKYKAVLSKVE